MDNDSLECAIIIFFVVILISITICSAYLESKSYNKLCNGNSTLMDAVVTELRVDGSCNSK